MSQDVMKAGVPWRWILWGAAGAVILLPAVAMQFDTGVNWGPMDFALAVVLFGGAGLAAELAVRISRNKAYRVAAALGLGTALLTIWINLAVGIVGNEDRQLNLMYLALPLIAAVGSVISGFKAQGMSYTMFAASAAQLIVGGIALFLAGFGEWVPISAVFAAMWLVAGGLFRRAASDAAS
jgi:hypothetical protein